MKFRVLITAPYFQPVVSQYEEVFKKNNIELVLPPVVERLDEQELIKYIGDIHGVIAGDDQFTKSVIGKAKNLRAICKWGTGIDSIDQDACKEAGILVTNTEDAFSNPVADNVMGYILMFARRLWEMNAMMKKGEWDKLQCRALNECTLGVIGIGNVGRAVLSRARSFGMKLLGNDIKDIDPSVLQSMDVKLLPIDMLLELSDFVSINCDLNETSYHLLSEDAFSAMKKSAYLINTARGPVIDEKALISALDNKEIKGAALDVFEYEPLPSDHPFRQMENVILAPHNSNSSPTAWSKVHNSTVNSLIKCLKECIKTK